MKVPDYRYLKTVLGSNLDIYNEVDGTKKPQVTFALFWADIQYFFKNIETSVGTSKECLTKFQNEISSKTRFIAKLDNFNK